ncbi:MAG: hypothetical protein IIA45_12260 [Bacteroidetes bacterium]|nr:hypothetical protein [Bacteroidota bacterium]
MYKLIIVLIFTAVHLFAYSQESESTLRERKVSRPEYVWAFTHLRIAKKAYRLTQEARVVANDMKTSTALDGDANGGQVDAFRHTFWMAYLSQTIKTKKVLRLGQAHEKGNRLAFKRGRYTNEFLPDLPSCKMDLWNNKIGVHIGTKNRSLTPEGLTELILAAMERGELRIIKKDEKGNYLDENNHIIPPSEWQDKWDNAKVVIPSD